MLKSPDIVVIQIGELGVYRFRILAQGRGLNQGVDFVALSLPHGVEMHLLADVPQLLITGNFPDGINVLHNRIEELRSKYPMLVVVGYSSARLKKELFDEVVSKQESRSFDRVLQAIEAFRSGELRRQSAD
jgi:hypothetical protein